MNVWWFGQDRHRVESQGSALLSVKITDRNNLHYFNFWVQPVSEIGWMRTMQVKKSGSFIFIIIIPGCSSALCARMKQVNRILCSLPFLRFRNDCSLFYLKKENIYLQNKFYVQGFEPTTPDLNLNNLTTWSLPIRSVIHDWAVLKSVLTLIRPSFPLLLMSWSGLATSFWKSSSKTIKHRQFRVRL